MGQSLGFEIRHFSIHEGKSGDDVRWINVNIIFSVDDEYRMYVEPACQDWLVNVLYETRDAKEITDFYERQAVGEFSIKEHPLRRKGLTMNDDNYLIYLQKFGLYRFSEIVEDNRVTRAVLREIGALHGDGRDVVVGGRFVPISRLMRCLRTLSTFWD